MQNKLENSQLTVLIDSFGAEMQSIQHEGIEYLWQADPTFWGRHASVLFPIVGRLKDGKYQYEGKTYEMSGHGFARDSEFQLLTENKDGLAYQLTESAETLEHYPFKFILTIAYRLIENQIEVSYELKNPDDRPLYFSIGGHPAFNVPLEKGSYENYALTLSPRSKRSFIPFNVETGLLHLSEEKQVADYKKPLSRELFKNDALIYKAIGKNEVKLANNLDKHSVTLSWNSMPYFGLWSPYPKEAPFVCIEPWCGIADDSKADGELSKKAGINQLVSDETFRAGYKIEIV